MNEIDRRKFLKVGAGVTFGALLLPLEACSNSSEPSTSPTTTAGSTGTTLPATPSFLMPTEIVSESGLLEATLVAEAAMVAFDGSERWAYTYGGSTPGPTMRARPGDLLRIRLVNRLDESTNLHTHGLHVSPTGNSDNVFVSVEPGDEFVYEIQLPENHRGGTFWYHPHRHGFVAGQVSGGLAGMIIVEDESDSDPFLAVATERVMVLSDPTIGTDASVLSVSRMERMNGRQGDLVTVNGVHRPTIVTDTGSLERWRLVNASPSRYHRLVLDGAPMVLAGTDGGLLEVPRSIDSLLIAPGERAELLVPASESGTITLRSEPYDRGGMGGGSSQGDSEDLVELDVRGSDSEVSVPERIAGAALPDRPDITGQRSLKLSMGGGGGGGMSFMIDDKVFDHERIDNHLVIGDVEEWTVTNESNMDHPFHIHVWQFTVVDASDQSLISPGLKDTVNVPAQGWVKFVLEITDYPGKAVYHCHILDHEDQGMMGVFETTTP